MQKYDDINIVESFTELIGLTNEISEILMQDTATDLEKISMLSKLYDKRSVALENIKKWTESDEGKEIISKNKEDWHSFLGTALKKEKLNVDNINDHVHSLEKKLRELPLQKKLLIYKK